MSGNQDAMVWNVRGATNAPDAVSMMRYGAPGCTVSPSCVTKSKPFGHTLAIRKKFRHAMEELAELACDDYYRQHGLNDYHKRCEELFKVSRRRGYVQLVFTA